MRVRPPARDGQTVFLIESRPPGREATKRGFDGRGFWAEAERNADGADVAGRCHHIDAWDQGRSEGIPYHGR